MVSHNNLIKIDVDDLEPDDESVDTPLVSPFLNSDDDSDDGEVLNELKEYGNAGQLCRKRAINSFNGDDLAVTSRILRSILNLDFVPIFTFA
ncbi:hypothetical protein Tco_0503860 [Tanacetum coccineum]